jgi:hypothetical protein
LTLDLSLWNAVISTATLLVVAATAIAALRQIRHLRAQNTLAGLLKILEHWRDPAFQRALHFVTADLPRLLDDPQYMADLDRPPVDRTRHLELEVCDWYEQIGSYMKYGLLDEEMLMDVSSSSCNSAWASLEPVIARMRRTRGDTLYENFEYMAARGVLFQRAHPNGCYPPDTPRLAELGGPFAYGRPRAAESPSAGEAAPAGTT